MPSLVSTESYGILFMTYIPVFVQGNIGYVETIRSKAILLGCLYVQYSTCDSWQLWVLYFLDLYSYVFLFLLISLKANILSFCTFGPYITNEVIFSVHVVSHVDNCSYLIMHYCSFKEGRLGIGCPCQLQQIQTLTGMYECQIFSGFCSLSKKTSFYF